MSSFYIRREIVTPCRDGSEKSMTHKGLLIGFMAKKRAGKDTSADYLCVKHGFVKQSFAAPLKKACGAMFNFTQQQIERDYFKEKVDPTWGITPRQAFQFVGTELIRAHMDELISGVGAGFWIRNMQQRIDNLRKENPEVNIVISDVRFQNEVDMIHELGGKVIKIERDTVATRNKAGKHKKKQDTHASEMDMDSIDNYDAFITNDGTKEDLYKNIEISISSI